ncbi:MAG: hypothetical protein LBH25_11305 [Fibromonadaceae bacterium]|jgi:hypothetical protein|nr:hypothetical protein [Fibromonadaceae bacterium]
MKKFLKIIGVVFKIVKTVIILMPLFLVAYLFFPVKFALKQKDLNALEKPYFLIEWTQVTGSSWMIVGDQNGYYEQVVYIVDDKNIQAINNVSKYIIGNGEMPSVVRSDDFTMWPSTYVGYVNYVGERDIGINKTISEYEFTGWDVLYPVKRDGFLFFLESYICKWDFIDEWILIRFLFKLLVKEETSPLPVAAK